MQYALLIYEDEATNGVLEGPHRLRDQHMAFVGDLRDKGLMTAGAGLRPSTAVTTVRAEGGRRTLHDGPFAEIREQLAGFYVVEVPDLDAALAIARRVPVVDGGSVEVRPVL